MIVALFIGGMQVYIAYQQKKIADRQAQVAKIQGEILAVSGWLPFLKDDDPNVRYMSVIALERVGTDAVIAPLAAALSDDHEIVRNQAASALSKLPSEKTIDIVVDILGNQDVKTVNAAIDTLQRIGDKSLPKLQQALARADPRIRSNAQKAIERLLLNEHAMKKIGALAAHQLTMGNADIIVAIIGAGVDQSISDIKNALVEEVNYVHDSGRSGVSTTMAARLIVGTSGSDVVGVAPGIGLISERVLGESGAGEYSTIIRGIRHAIKAGTKVIYLELGGPIFNDALQQAINEAHSAGSLIVAPAGNSNDETKHFPAAMDNVFAVAATDANDKKADYSSYGDWVDISAPGNPVDKQKFADSKLSFLKGTSFSGSLVAGAAALVWSLDSSLNTQQVENILINSTDNIDAINFAYKGKLGSGRLNVLQAINRVQHRSE